MSRESMAFDNTGFSSSKADLITINSSANGENNDVSIRCYYYFLFIYLKQCLHKQKTQKEL